MRYVDPPRCAFGAPPQGGAAGGPAEPDPRRPLGLRAMALPLFVILCCSGCSLLPDAPAEVPAASPSSAAAPVAKAASAPKGVASAESAAAAPKPVESEVPVA